MKNNLSVERFRSVLTDRQIHFSETSTQDFAETPTVRFTISLQGKHISDPIFFVYIGESGKVTFRTFVYIGVPKGKRDAIRLIINETNRKMDFVKFYLDSDFDVIGEYHGIIYPSQEAGQQIMLLLDVCAAIVNSAAPALDPAGLSGCETGAATGDTLLQTMFSALRSREEVEDDE